MNLILRIIYINKKNRITKWKAKKISKKLYKLKNKEEILVVISKNLADNSELITNLKEYNINYLNRKMAFKIYAL